MLFRKPNLFQLGNFRLHAGGQSNFKIECDALNKKDWETLAKLISIKYSFVEIYGIPKGGLNLSKPLEKYINSSQNILIVDDVYNTGASMEEAKKELIKNCPNKKEKNIIGIVVFARNSTPAWIKPIFQMW